MSTEIVPVQSPLSICRVRLNPLDLLLMLVMWGVVFAASIKNFGYLPAIIFFSINVVLILRSSVNGILVLLLIFYSPTVSLQVGNVFVYSFLIAALRCFNFDAWRGALTAENRLLLITTGIFVLYLSITLLFAPDMELAFTYYSKYLEGIALLFLFLSAANSQEKLGIVLKWWAIAAALALFLKLAHQHLGSATYLYDIMKHNVRRDFTLDQRLTIEVAGSLAKRLIMPGEEPNYTSAGLIFPFGAALAFFSTSRPGAKLFWMIVVALIAVSAVGTYSRSGFIGVVLVLALYLLRGHIKALIPAGIFLGGLLYLIFSIPQLHDRIFGIGKEIGKGASGRFILWDAAKANWLESPIWGKGFAFFYHRYHEAVHSSYMHLLVETGIIGLVLFVSIILISLFVGSRVKYLYRGKPDQDERFSRVIIGGLIGASFMIGTVTYQDIKLFWMACGACTAMYVVTKKERGEPSASISDGVGDDCSGWCYEKSP